MAPASPAARGAAVQTLKAPLLPLLTGSRWIPSTGTDLSCPHSGHVVSATCHKRQCPPWASRGATGNGNSRSQAREGQQHGRGQGCERNTPEGLAWMPPVGGYIRDFKSAQKKPRRSQQGHTTVQQEAWSPVLLSEATWQGGCVPQRLPHMGPRNSQGTLRSTQVKSRNRVLLPTVLPPKSPKLQELCYPSR